MSSASDTTRRRKERMLFASKVIQETYTQKGWTNRTIYEGAANTGIMTYPTYDTMRDGTTVTTPVEQQEYSEQVPNRTPDPPTNIIATNAAGGANVYFTPPSYIGVCPITYYTIVAEPGGITETSTESPVLITGLESGVGYTFSVTAYNCVGPSIPASTEEPFYTIGLASQPRSVSATAGDSQATVSFLAPTTDGGAEITNYTVVSNPGDITANASSSPVVVTGLTNGTSYTFTVTATNANGDSSPSSASNSVIPKTVPDPPTNVTPIRGNAQATVQFVAPLNNGGDPVTSYTVTSSPGGFTATGASSPLIVSGLTNGVVYTFTAVATNSVGNSSPSDVSPSVTPATIPDPPTGVSAIAGNGQAVVSFTAPVNNGGSTITSYTVTSSPGGFTATGGSSPITVLGLSNGIGYTFTVVATNGIGNSVASSASNAVIPAGSPVPSAPTNVSALPGTGNTTATIRFTASATGSPTSYTVTSSPGGFTATGVGSPLTVTGLTAGTNYTFSVVATNGSGNSNPGISNLITAGSPLAPVLTSTFPTVNDVSVSFTQPGNSTATITNYKYSVNGGPYTSFSPADNVSPVVIPGLSANTSYTISLKATNINGDSLASNTLSVTTYTTLHTQSFTTTGTTSWTAPAGVTFVQYLVVGGGGGGGSCYSDIQVIGDLPFVTASPGPTAYWINKNGGTLYGTFWRGNGYANVTKPFRASVLSILNNVPPTITPTNTRYVYNKWYADQIVYNPSYSIPNTTNYLAPYYTINSTYSNNISGGSGGGAGGRIRSLSGISTYSVTPGATYTVTVGAGGTGAVGAAGSESAGGPGGNSVFDTITSEGGSGGNTSRAGAFSTNGYGNGGNGGQNGGNFVGGRGGSGLGAAPSNYGLYNSGGAGGFGAYLDFDGTGAKTYGVGGPGGVPNTPASGSTPANLGRGGSGTGATLNSFASGIDGGSGVVILKWYT